MGGAAAIKADGKNDELSSDSKQDEAPSRSHPIYSARFASPRGEISWTSHGLDSMSSVLQPFLAVYAILRKSLSILRQRRRRSSRFQTRISAAGSTVKVDLPVNGHASACVITFPPTSVRRKSRPWNRNVSFVWSSPSRWSIVAWMS